MFQRHHSTATDADLAKRMRRWVSGEQYDVALVERDGLPVAYAVWCDDEDGIYVRQYFVSRDHRREGLGRAGFAALVDRWGDRPVLVGLRRPPVPAPTEEAARSKWGADQRDGH